MRLATFLLAAALLAPGSARAASFRRGDVNQDAKIDLSDAIAGLGALFLGASVPSCRDALDANDDGRVDISDPVSLLNFLFTGGGEPPPPFEACGGDPTPDDLDCVESAECGALCLDQEDLDAAIADSIPPSVCLPPDQVVPAGTLTVTVCPLDTAPPCAAGGRGCVIELRDVQGALEGGGERVRVSLTAVVSGLPVLVDTGVGTTRCTANIELSGDAVGQLALADNGDGTRTILGLSEPVLENTFIDLTADGGFVCRLFEGAKDLFQAEAIAALEEPLSAVTAELRAELVGKTICSGG